MTMTSDHSRNTRRIRGLLAGAGLVLTGATLAAVGTVVLPVADAGAATVNYVRSANPDAVSGVLLDEEVTIQFNVAVLASSVGPDTVLVRTGINNGEQASGRYVVGSFLYDRSVQRRAVIRPEAVREYFELVKQLPREDAERAAKALIRRVEATGRLSLLRVVDQQLAVKLGPRYGSRLDDETTPIYGIYPAQQNDLTPGDNDDPLTLDAGDSPLEPYRSRIAGDEDLWEAYLAGDVNAYEDLSQNSEYERFYHPVDPATGVPSASSVLRQREYRRVLINRKNGARVMFVPEIPIRNDMADTGYTPGRAYSLIVPASQPGVYNTVLSQADRRPLLQTRGRDFSTLFTTVPSTTTSLFRDSESRTGITTLQLPRVINQTPPNGELLVDPSTDWEDPDNTFAVPIPARRTFTIRLRFAQPLDPRTVDPTRFTLTKKATLDTAGNETPVSVPVAIGTFLNQHRLGIVEVEITPATNLDAQGKYEVVVKNSIRSLGGVSPKIDYQTTFLTGAGKPPLDAIRESFTQVTNSNKADPTNPDTFGQITTAYWPAPPLYDPGATGKLAASFMQFVGTGVGALSDPRNPGSPVVPSLNLSAGNGITFVTEQLIPGDSVTLGTQIEYNYVSVAMHSAAAGAIGRFPLVIRSQSDIELDSSVIRVAGNPGGDGKANSDVVGGPPEGGLGGSAGPGGFRGGDGGCAPVTGPDGGPLLDVGGNLQFDQAKFNGSDGFPSFLVTGPNTGGGGSGGFSGDREAPNDVECAGDPTIIDKDDVQCTPKRVREAGGGGGHATVGGDGFGTGLTKQFHTGGYKGGAGGKSYGKADFSDQPRNGLFGTVGVPRLGFGAGGAGGAGGGAEDSSTVGGVLSGTPDTVAGPADSGGGGGGGGGGGIQLVARTGIHLTGTVIDASGGKGGRTFNAANSDYGFGAPGGCGAGGSIWFLCFGDIIIENGSTVTAAGGDNATSIGYITSKPDNKNPALASPLQGKGGLGGDGYVRFEDSDGSASISLDTKVLGVLTQDAFVPYDNPLTTAPEADFKAFPGTPFVVNVSQGFSVWFNTFLDTPSFATHYNTSVTSVPNGTSVFAPGGPDEVKIWVRSAPNNTANTGHPNLNLATSSGNAPSIPWTTYDDVGTISRRRFLQFRVDFTLPLNYDFNVATLPYVDYLQIDIDLN